jgi:glucans biosynthesis protein
VNCERLQFSAFSDVNPKGFGLLQRNRNYPDYQDLEGHYHERPSVWVEPVGDWGEGTIDLLELPTAEEVNDNVVVFWRPKNGLTGVDDHPHHYRYRLHWCWKPPVQNDLAWVSSVRVGKSWNKGARLIVTEFMGLQHYEGTQLSVDLKESAGKIDRGQGKINLIPNPAAGGWRLAFDYIPASGDADIRGVLLSNGKPASEVWTFRWTA